MGDETEVERLGAARAAVLDRIAAACRRSGRDPSEVRLVAVSKTVQASRLRAAVAAGLTDFGENRVQEAAAKVGTVAGATWSLVGALQSNKARKAVELFDGIQTVDSVALAARLGRLAQEFGRAPLRVLLQVNVDADPRKAGFSPDEVRGALPTILGTPGLAVEGLMTVGRLGTVAEDARPTFAALRDLAGELRVGDDRLGPELSMGMSDDFEVAVEAGTTIVRIGRALFGERPAAEVALGSASIR